MITPEMLARGGSEHGEQTAVFCWASQNYHRFPMLRWMHAIPNGGKRDKITAASLKAEGVKAGVADIFLPCPRVITERWVTINGDVLKDEVVTYHGLYIEMKRANGKMSDITEEQQRFAEHCEVHRYAWICAFGWKNATVGIEKYLTAEFMMRDP